ncbi:MFS transporter [Staphylococcus sp. EZ-P03]|uniref:MFS transporter n=1 Tax=Staphylococcus sp. EZ-P03 TaxID=2282739 RepID=UPI000DF860CC|nr:MFS transporter [Staphylococcus sp. EZ-P03]
MDLKFYRWIILLIGVLAQMTFSIGYAGVAVSGLFYREFYGFTLSQVGFILGCMALGVALSELIWGALTDYLGDKLVLLIGLLGSAICFFMIGKISGNIPNYYIYCLLLILAGTFGGSVNSSSGRAVMSWFTYSQRGLAMSIRQTAIPIGAAIGSFLFPTFISKYGFVNTFFMQGSLCIISSICVCIWLKKLENKQHNKTSEVSEDNDVKSPYKRVYVWEVAIVGGILTVSQMAILTFSSVYLHDVYDVKMIVIVYILMVVQILGGILRIILGGLSDKYKNRVTFLIYLSLGIGITSIILSFIATSYMMISIILLFILGILSNSWTSIAYTYIAEISGVKFAGRALGMIGTTVFVVAFIIPFIIPTIIHYFNWNGLWLIVSILTFLAIVLINKKKDEVRKIL